MIEQFEVVGGRGYFRPQGTVSYEECVRMTGAALRHAREQGLSEVVLNLTGLGGFAPPKLSDRYALISGWAGVLGGSARLAVVVRPEFVDPGKFGVNVAANRGLESDVFVSESAADAWLDRGR